MTTQRNHIDTVRAHLLDTLADLRNRDKPMEVDRARAVAQVASVIVDTARVEVDYLKATNQTSTPFMDAQKTVTTTEGLPAGIVSITQHRIGA